MLKYNYLIYCECLSELVILSFLNYVNRLAINRQLYIEDLPIYKKPKGGALKNEQHDNGNTKTRMDVLDYRQDKF